MVQATIGLLLFVLLCHQDLYIDHLTKQLERLTRQAAMHEVQRSAQAEETQAAKEAFSEVTVVTSVSYETHLYDDKLWGHPSISQHMSNNPLILLLVQTFNCSALHSCFDF